MNVIIKVVIWTLVVLGYVSLIVGALFVPLLWVPAGMLLAWFVYWIVRKSIRNKRGKAENIPQDILDDFNALEEKYIEHEGRIEPHRLFWELYKYKKSVKGGAENGQRRIREEE